MFIDHFVWVASNLLEEMERFSQVLGLKPIYGGSHPGKGTHNALIYLGGQCYLELLAPDPEQVSDQRWIIGNRPLNSGLIHWAWRTTDLQREHRVCMEAGWDLGAIQEGQRLREDQSLLQWRSTDPDHYAIDFQPFLIEWLTGQHPTDGLIHSCNLQSISVAHPTPEALHYRTFMPEWPASKVYPGSQCLAIKLETPRGHFILQSGIDRIIATEEID